MSAVKSEPATAFQEHLKATFTPAQLEEFSRLDLQRAAAKNYCEWYRLNQRKQDWERYRANREKRRASQKVYYEAHREERIVKMRAAYRKRTEKRKAVV